MKLLQTVDQVLDALGGHKRTADNNKAIAAWLGIGTSAVCNWRERGSIPPGYHLRFYRAAERRGMEISLPVVFGLEDSEEPPAVKKKRVAA
jgi:hypothetical protein